jgi:formylglycine-generating enzyme required for sulfatase activity
MKLTRLWTGLAILLGTALTGFVLPASGGQALDLHLQMVPGIWIHGATGAVSIEYTTNLDQASGWTRLVTVQATNSPSFYADAAATNTIKRFYRAVVEDALNPDPQHLAWIHSGTFMMGSSPEEVDRQPIEGPQTQVTISQGFWMSRYEVTQEEYQSVTGTNPSFFTGEMKRPVEMVSWLEATNYCGQLTARERAAGRLPAGYEYRLPTEAEWEYACRTGTTTRFSFGDDLSLTPLDGYAWYYSNSGNTTHPVGLKQPNAWGLYDMNGNVGVWCSDWHGTYSGGSVTDPRGPATGAYRAVRGGIWALIGWYCRTACRSSESADNRSDSLGFRSVLAPAQ